VVDPGVDVLLVWVPVFGGGGVVLTAAVGFFLADAGTAAGAAFGGFF
jgi:hypothetical protein